MASSSSPSLSPPPKSSSVSDNAGEEGKQELQGKIRGHEVAISELEHVQPSRLRASEAKRPSAEVDAREDATAMEIGDGWLGHGGGMGFGGQRRKGKGASGQGSRGGGAEEGRSKSERQERDRRRRRTLSLIMALYISMP